MAKSAVLALKITGDASGARAALDDVEGKSGRFGKVWGGIGAGIAAGAAVAGTALIGLGVAAFNAASDAQQAAGAVDAVFGKNAQTMKDYAAQAAQTVGLAASEYNQLASVLGSQLSNAGFAGDQLSGTVNNLVGLGSDLAAQFGGSTADAVQALSSVLKGETDPIEAYGVSIKQSDINARLAALGQDKLTGSALKNATAQAALALVTEQTASAHGAFAREGDTAAGAQARLSATWENAQAALGERLLPVVAQGATFLTGLLGPAMDAISDKNGFLSQGFAALSAFVTGQVVPTFTSLWNELGPKLIPILQQVGQFVTGVVVPAFSAVWSIVQTYVVPIISSVLSPALSGVQQLFGILSEKVEENKGKFLAIYDKIKPFLDFLKNTVAPMIGTILVNSFTVLSSVIGPVIDAITWVLDKAASVIGFVGNVGSAIGSFFSAPAPAAGGGAAPTAGLFGAAQGLRGAGSSSAGGSIGPGAAGRGPSLGPTVNVTVNGALDPVAVGKQIDRILRDYGAASGRRSVAIA